MGMCSVDWMAGMCLGSCTRVCAACGAVQDMCCGACGLSGLCWEAGYDLGVCVSVELWATEPVASSMNGCVGPCGTDV